MSTQINLDVLKGFKADLYNAVVESLGLGPITGIIQVSKLQWFGFPEDVRSRLVEFLRLQAPSPEHDLQTCGCNDCFQKRASENNAREAARLEVVKQNVPGRARLMEYIKRGLLDNPSNRDAFLTFIDQKFPGLTVIRPDHVDAFVAAKRNELQWKAPEPAPAPTPEPAARTLPNGEPELPLDADEASMRRASILQLKDLSKRRGEGKSWFKRGKDVGSFGGSFFQNDAQVP